MNRFFYELQGEWFHAWDRLHGDEVIAMFLEREHAEAFVEKMNEVLPLRDAA